MLTVRVDVEGPVSTGEADREAEAFTHELVRTVAREGFHDVQMTFAVVLKQPTGYHESRQHLLQTGATQWTVDDTNQVYGPWLEGVGSRNYPVTRFKGYHTYRKVFQKLVGRVNVIATRLIIPYVNRMNGR